MIKLVRFIDLNEDDKAITVCQECGALVHKELKEEHQQWHTKIWLLDPQHRILQQRSGYERITF